MSLLDDLKPSDITEIKLDGEEDALVIKVLVPVAEGHNTEYEEVIHFDKDTPMWLKEAAVTFREAAMKALKERVTHQKELPCATCTGACCRGWDVRVTEEDVNRLTSAHPFVDSVVAFWDGGSVDKIPKTWLGFVGQLKQKNWKGPGEKNKACVFLEDNGCSVYEHRPQVCRDFSAWECDRHEMSPDKDPTLGNKRVRLRVVT